MPLNSIDRRCAKASIEVNRPENTEPTEADDIELSLVVEAIGEAGMQDKEFAINGRLDPGQWARIKGGVGNLHAKVLLRQPARFWIALDGIQRRRLGISDETEQSIRRRDAEETADVLFDRFLSRLLSGKREHQ
jgi:hypothetical protein